MHSKHLLTLSGLPAEDVRAIVIRAAELKREPNLATSLSRKTLGLIFEKSSTRTRVSFEVAMTQLGGKASFLSVNDLQLGRGEPIEDTAIVLSSMVDGLVLRTLDHETQIKFSENSTVPVINGLSNKSHPCQLLADSSPFMKRKDQ